MPEIKNRALPIIIKTHLGYIQMDITTGYIKKCLINDKSLIKLIRINLIEILKIKIYKSKLLLELIIMDKNKSFLLYYVLIPIIISLIISIIKVYIIPGCLFYNLLLLRN